MKLLFLLLNFGKLSKIFTTGGTMLLSVFVYAWMYGWRFAVGFVMLLFCHEMGHYVAARQKGLNVGAPTFVPFVGAWIALKELPHNAETEAYIGIAGPIVGTFASLACYFFARSESNQLMLALSYSGFLLNLFNLIPLPPFDGGRITAAISHHLWLLGLPLLITVFIWRPSPLLVLMMILAAMQIWQIYKNRNNITSQNYYSVPAGKRFEYGVLYIGLTIYLSVMTYDVHQMLEGGINTYPNL